MIALHPSLDRAVQRLGWTELTPVQEEVIPLLRAGRDVLAQAQTGTGKTAAFALPLLERTAPGGRAPAALVVVPTRELAAQVAREFAALGHFTRARIAVVYGGVGYHRQETALRRGVDVVVGTPGRLLDLVARGSLDLTKVSTLILDEADRLLDLGFAPDIRRIVDLLPKERQTALFSATLTPEVRQIARRYTTGAATVAVRSEEPIADTIDQAWVEVFEADKVKALREILDRDTVGRALVFRRTKRGVDALVRTLRRFGYAAAALHGDLAQAERERTLEAFRAGKIATLVATNLAARGLHVEDIGHVVNFDLPDDPETYVHRIGRTGRMGKRGIALTFVTEWQYDEFAELKRKARVPFRQERLALYSYAAEATSSPLPSATRLASRPGRSDKRTMRTSATGRAAGAAGEDGAMRQSGFPCRFAGCERTFQVVDQRSMEALHAASAARTAHEVAEHGYHHQRAPEVKFVPPFLRSAAKNGGWRRPTA